MLDGRDDATLASSSAVSTLCGASLADHRWYLQEGSKGGQEEKKKQKKQKCECECEYVFVFVYVCVHVFVYVFVFACEGSSWIW